METIEKIRKYIENLYDGEAPAHDQQCDFEDGYFTGIATISNFLDTLSEEPDKSLEEEIQKCWENWLSPSNQPSVEGVFPKSEFIMYARHFAEWQKEQDTREMIMSDGSYFQKCYKQGKKDMKEQMLKGAVEYKIVNNLAAYPVIYYEVNHLGLKYGDKVRIVILKEKEE